MNQYVFGAICLAVLIAFGSFYLTSDLGGNSHFDKAGENWKRKWVVTIFNNTLFNNTLLDHSWSLRSTINNRVSCASKSAAKQRIMRLNLDV